MAGNFPDTNRVDIYVARACASFLEYLWPSPDARGKILGEYSSMIDAA